MILDFRLSDFGEGQSFDLEINYSIVLYAHSDTGREARFFLWPLSLTLLLIENVAEKEEKNDPNARGVLKVNNQVRITQVSALCKQEAQRKR